MIGKTYLLIYLDQMKMKLLNASSSQRDWGCRGDQSNRLVVKAIESKIIKNSNINWAYYIFEEDWNDYEMPKGETFKDVSKF